MLLIFTSKPREGEVVQIHLGRFTIGRTPDNDLHLRDGKVSRHHAVIEKQPGGETLLRDLGSRNGTYVNGQRLSGPRVLGGGERLRLGDQHLRVEPLAPAASPLATPAGHTSPARPPGPSPEQASPHAASAPASAVAEGAQRPTRPARIPAAFRSRRGLAAGGVLLLLALVFGVGQLVLPGVAERHLRSQLGRYGPVRVVKIASAPAVKLLWHRADSVTVVMDSYRSEPGGHGSLGDFLSRTRSTGNLDVRVGTLHSQLLTLHDVRLRKEGDELVGQARLTQRDLTAALPSFLGLRPVSASADGIVVQVVASAFGHRAGTKLDITADGGRMVVRPQGLLGSFATITVFNDPRVYVESLGAELRGDNYFLTVRARLR
jgi:FHA domain-containing protein/DUF2993 family protein